MKNLTRYQNSEDSAFFPELYFFQPLSVFFCLFFNLSLSLIPFSVVLGCFQDSEPFMEETEVH